jgi:hypothetical protein
MADGVVYEGDWAEGQINGQGTLTQPNGDVYSGALVDGQRQGRAGWSMRMAMSTRAIS